MRTLTLLLLSFVLSTLGFSQACKNDSLLPKKPWVTGISSKMHESMALTQQDGVHTDFHGIWMHMGWKNNFGPCAQSYPWTRPEYFQTVIDSGKTPVVYWWWHHDNPQSSYLRQEAEQQLKDCLVPFLNDINRPDKEVWIVLQPEYNMQNVHQDAAFATHLIKMIDDLKGNVTGVKIKVGPCPGNFGNMEDRYRLHPSLEGVLEKSDFIAFHDIQRGTPPSDSEHNFPVPGQRKSSLSFCRFLHNEYHKPIFFAYWSVANQQFSQEAQANALKDIFAHQAEFERYGVFGFGPFWYQSDNGFPTEGIKTTSNTPFPVWYDYKDIVNNIAAGTDYIHSMSFLDFDYGQNIDLPITLRWISTGKTGAGTYSVYYQIEGEPRVLIADNLQGSSNEIMRLNWEPCNFPTTPVMNFIVVANDGTECTSPKVSYNNPESYSDAIYNFENGNITDFEALTSGLSLETSTIAASGTNSLQVNLANDGVGWNYVKVNGPIAYTGDNTLEMMVYVPYSLNNTMDMGAEVTYCTFYMQTTQTWRNFDSPKFSLNQGWNKIKWDFTLNGNDPQEISNLEIRLWNRMSTHNDVAKILIDDIKFGGSVVYGTPNNTCSNNASQLSSCSRYGGTVSDCNGDVDGTAFLDNCGTCVGGNTGLTACEEDCNGVFGGNAYTDNCGTCVDGNTGLTACEEDCNGVFGGNAYTDNCGTCVGGNTGLTACEEDCNGVFGGNAFTDNCGTCVGGNTGLTACEEDCNGVFGGNAYTDNCGTCVGGNTGLTACEEDCNGVFGGNAYTDNCGTCVGGNTGLTACEEDCNGVFGGNAYTDNCGTCVGGNTGLTACEEDCNGVFGGNAFTDDCGTCVGGNTGLTANPDADNDGVLDCEDLCPGYNDNYDRDNDGIPNGCDSDIDGDGIDNDNDCEPRNKNIGQATTWYEDLDGDGIGSNVTQTSCSQPNGYVDINGDQCPNDANKTFPGACGCGNEEGACVDCNNDANGSAFTDNCGECVGGNTGLTACKQDCNGDWGGSAFIDKCGDCSGGNTGITPETNPLKCFTSTDDKLKENKLEIYPNPFSSETTIYFNGTGTFNLTITDLRGIVIEQKVLNTNSYHLLGSQYAKGVYIGHIKTDNREYAIRILKN